MCARLPSWVRIFITLRDDGLIPPRLRSQTHIRWHEIDISAVSNDHDIRVYITKRVRIIGVDRDLKHWPIDFIVYCLCEKADGLFVWAVVACNLITDVDLDPFEQFEELVCGDSSLRDTRASSQLDELYSKVLSKCYLDEPRALSRYDQCVGTSLILKRPLSILAINNLLGIKHAQYTLRPLAPILVVLAGPHQQQLVQIIYQSFRDFVTQEIANSSSLKQHMIVPSEHNESLALHCLVIISKEMPLLTEHTGWIVNMERDCESSIPKLRDCIISEALWYACVYVMEHIDAVAQPVPALSDALIQFLRDACTDD